MCLADKYSRYNSEYTKYTNYDEALKAFLSSQGLDEQEFNYHIGRLLQQMAYDVYVNNEQKAYKQALEK